MAENNRTHDIEVMDEVYSEVKHTHSPRIHLSIQPVGTLAVSNNRDNNRLMQKLIQQITSRRMRQPRPGHYIGAFEIRAS